ncbi:Rap1a/Tai family immunity protein [Cypionkella sp.]|uniref:Rap1a/Tai family immunity protein n=1 Tax=Cypionkella sp. TaxID=2811411 RepID=UPI002AB80AC5|nr:Rap1a/Tai family immunity protein [Cypionkella sp.]MDZ4393513.1 Rap1a/Tai family immunity protein [Cypionkella sp.]
MVSDIALYQRVKKIAAAGAVFLCFPLPVESDSRDVTGLELMGFCSAAEVTARAGFCRGYVRGMLEGMSAHHDRNITGHGAPAAPGPLCIAEQTSLSDIIKILMTYLAAHPAERSGPATSVFATAMQAKFPCVQ